ncbi:MAG: response regulator transcription factor [Ilumatobacteraceae bacterium]
MAPTMKVLVVEDDREIASFVKRGLEAEGFTVELAFDGVQGLWLATEYRYDLLVLDLMLPEKNGFQVCAELRAAEIWTPMLMLTAKDGDLDEAEALDTGAERLPHQTVLVPGPRRPPPALARRANGQAPAMAAAGDLRIDPVTHRAWRGDDELALSAREFSLLEYLVRRAGQVLSKDQVISGVWDTGFAGNPNIVEVYVSRLRDKIDRPFNRHAIETVRGVGYRLAADGG